MLNECATTLDLQPVPELYIEQDPTPAAMAIGLDKPIIVVSTGMLELVDDEGLRFIIGHEVGHVLSGHAVYRTMLTAVDQSRCRHAVAADRRLEHPGDHPRPERVVPQVRVVLRSCRPAVLAGPERRVAGARKLAGAQESQRDGHRRLSRPGRGVREQWRRSRQPAEALADERTEPSAGRVTGSRTAEVGGRS